MNNNTVFLVTTGAITGGYLNYLFNESYYSLVYGYYPHYFNRSIFNYGFLVGSTLGYTASFFIGNKN